MKRLNVLVTDWRRANAFGMVPWIARTLDCAVWIKAYDGPRWLDLGRPFAVIAHELQEKGVDVGAWGYHYGYVGEAAVLRECYTYRHGLEGYEGPRAGLLIDAESEFEGSLARGDAGRQVRYLSDAQLPIPIYYTSFAFPQLHARFPYDVFNDLSGGHVPQVYYNHKGWPDPASSVLQCVSQHLYRDLKLAGVMLPIYDAGSESGWRPSPADLHQATLAASMWNVPSIWTWSWEYHRWEDWVALWHYRLLQEPVTKQ